MQICMLKLSSGAQPNYFFFSTHRQDRPVYSISLPENSRSVYWSIEFELVGIVEIA